MLGEQLLVDPRPVIEPLGVARRRQLDQIGVALVGLGKKDEMVGFGLRPALVEAAAGGDVDLAPQDRLEAAVLGVIVEDDRREHVAVLGDRERRHLELDRFIEELVDAAGAVEQRELRMQMEMDELRRHRL